MAAPSGVKQKFPRKRKQKRWSKPKNLRGRSRKEMVIADAKHENENLGLAQRGKKSQSNVFIKLKSHFFLIFDHFQLRQLPIPSNLHAPRRSWIQALYFRLLLLLLHHLLRPIHLHHLILTTEPRCRPHLHRFLLAQAAAFSTPPSAASTPAMPWAHRRKTTKT